MPLPSPDATAKRMKHPASFCTEVVSFINVKCKVQYISVMGFSFSLIDSSIHLHNLNFCILQTQKNTFWIMKNNQLRLWSSRLLFLFLRKLSEPLTHNEDSLNKFEFWFFFQLFFYSFISLCHCCLFELLFKCVVCIEINLKLRKS